MRLQVCEGEEKEENTHARLLASSGRAGRGIAEIWPKASQARDLILPFIFTTSSCLIRFDRDISSQLWDAVTLGGSSLYIRAAVTEIATYQQPQKHQHI
jgi:hypothetical protein